MEEIGKPKCYNFEKCGHYAISLFMRRWCCGDCLVKAINKAEELKEKLVFEE